MSPYHQTQVAALLLAGAKLKNRYLDSMSTEQHG